MGDCEKDCSCEQYCTSVTAKGYAVTNSGNIVTATASALGCSEIGYEYAWFQALSEAEKTAYIEAQNSANIIDQTLDIIKEKIDKLVGPKGDTGPIGLIGETGPIGLRGLIGETGPIGLRGLIGVTGATGPVPDSSLFVTTNTSQTITNYKTFTNAILQNIISPDFSVDPLSGLYLPCDYGRGTIFYCTDPPTNFTLDLTNFQFPSAGSAAPYCVTVIINKTAQINTAFYANSLTINGASSLIQFNGGTTAVTTAIAAPTGANTVVQQFTIYYTPTQQPVICSVNVYF
jgi:hypothetical protein